MRRVGGFIGLAKRAGGAGPFHTVPALSTGRSCVSLIVEALKPKRVFLPFYICQDVPDSLRLSPVEIRRYPLNNALEISPSVPELKADDLLIYVNYFGLKSSFAARLSERFGAQVVIDNTQGFFHPGFERSWSFNSARKFFGVPDGAYLFSPSDTQPPNLKRAEPSVQHLLALKRGDYDLAFELYQAHEAGLDCTARKISTFSENQLAVMDYHHAQRQRRENFLSLSQQLNSANELKLALHHGDVPLCYPFLASDPELREKLFSHQVFTPQYWPELNSAAKGAGKWERALPSRLIPLPVDQRYTRADMEYVLNALEKES